MGEHDADEVPPDEPGSAAALAVAVVVLIAIVVLFLLFKFNLFNGGTSNGVKETLGALRTPGACAA